MTQTIDPAKLKAAAEHLEWVLMQYPDSQEVGGLRDALKPLIEKAKAQLIEKPVSRKEIPCSYNFADGLYVPYQNPSVGGAYAKFVTEMEGGLTDAEKQLHADIEAYKMAMKESQP